MKNINDDSYKLLRVSRLSLYRIFCITFMFECMVGGVALIVSTNESLLTIGLFFLYFLISTIVMYKFEKAYEESDYKMIKYMVILFGFVILINAGCLASFVINFYYDQFGVLECISGIFRLLGVVNNLFGVAILSHYMIYNASDEMTPHEKLVM
jgi:hypothetical protein